MAITLLNDIYGNGVSCVENEAKNQKKDST